MRALIVLASGLMLLLVAMIVVLGGSASVVGATNQVTDEGIVAAFRGRASFCQQGETVPAGTTAIRLSLGGVIGPAVSLRAISRGDVIAHGGRSAGWTGVTVMVPVNRVRQTVGSVELCIRVGQNNEEVRLHGKPTGAASSLIGLGQRLPGKMRVEYMRPAAESWWTLAPTLARRLGYGRSFSGSWIALMIVGAMLVALSLACALVIRESP